MKKFIMLLLFFFTIINYKSYLKGMEVESQDTEIQNYDLFKAVIEIRKIVDKYIDEYNTNKKLSIPKSTSESPKPNPYLCRTKKGLILNTTNGRPSSLSTPWGEIMLLRSGANLEDLELLSALVLDHLKGRGANLELLSDTIDVDHDNIKLYKVIAFDKINLPIAQAQDKSTYRKRDAIDNAWKILEERYQAENASL